MDLTELMTDIVRCEVAEARGATPYRTPIVGFASAADPRFADLKRIAEPTHYLPDDVLPGARAVVSFFLPFGAAVVQANARERSKVAREWPIAYLETNALIGRITDRLIDALSEWGVCAAAIPATHTYDPETLVCRWSHRSAAVIAGIASFGLHRMAITDAGCAGRFGTLIIDVELEWETPPAKERCLSFYDGSCSECISRCPIDALSMEGTIDKQRCNRRLLALAKTFDSEELADACGKCAIGPCSLESAVR